MKLIINLFLLLLGNIFKFISNIIIWHEI